jgi:hypothetical protein
MGGSIEESVKANVALGKIFPAMIAAALIVIVLQVRSLSTMTMVMLTAPLGLVGVAPMLIAFHQPFGFQQFETLTHPRSLRADEISGIRRQTGRGVIEATDSAYPSPA